MVAPSENSTVSIASKGFMTAKLFLKWLEHFEHEVPGTVKRPLVLVYDGYGSHYNDKIIQKAIEVNVILVLLSANITHFGTAFGHCCLQAFQNCVKKENGSIDD